VNDRAAFRTAAIICVLLCLIWDLATVVLFILLPLQLAAIGLLYWGADGLVRMGNAGSAQPRGGNCRPDAGEGGQQPVRRWPGGPGFS
jgi:hypothetical protein